MSWDCSALFVHPRRTVVLGMVGIFGYSLLASVCSPILLETGASLAAPLSYLHQDLGVERLGLCV